MRRGGPAGPCGGPAAAPAPRAQEACWQRRTGRPESGLHAACGAIRPPYSWDTASGGIRWHQVACASGAVRSRVLMRGAGFACTRSSPAAAPPAVAAVNETGAIPPGNAPGQTLWQQRRCVQGVAAAGWGALSTGILENHAHRLIPRRPAGAPSHPAPRSYGHHAPLRPTRTYTRTHAHTPISPRSPTRRPRQSKPEIRLTPGKGLLDLTCSLEELIDQVVKTCKVRCSRGPHLRPPAQQAGSTGCCGRCGCGGLPPRWRHADRRLCALANLPHPAPRIPPHPGAHTTTHHPAPTTGRGLCQGHPHAAAVRLLAPGAHHPDRGEGDSQETGGHRRRPGLPRPRLPRGPPCGCGCAVAAPPRPPRRSPALCSMAAVPAEA